MRIFTEETYQRKISQAKREGYEKAQREFFSQREIDDFQNFVRKEIMELNSRIIGIENLVMPSKKTTEKTTGECDPF
jgi:hypothetical protein